MSEFKVYHRQVADVVVTVDATDIDDALDKAWEELPGDICAHCSGWDKAWSRGMGDAEPYEVVDADGKAVWSNEPHEENR